MPFPPLATTREAIRYGFAVGKVRVLETRVFGKATYERLLDAPTFAEQQRILSDTVYGRYLEGANTRAEVEHALDRALDDFYLFIDEAGLPEPVIRFFRERRDFANLKGALKARALGISTEGLLVGLGSIPKDAFSGSLKDLPAPFGRLAVELSRYFEDEGAAFRGQAPAKSGSPGPSSGRASDLGDIDHAIDAAMFERLSELARESGSAFLKELVAYMTDIGNVKTLIRARLAGAPASSIPAMLLPGGSVPASRLAELAALPPIEAAVSLARLTPFAGIPMSDLSDPARLDVIADNVIAHFLGRGRRVPVGAEPVISYVLSREAEVGTLRTLLLGKLIGLNPDLLRSRLRDQVA